MRRDAVAVRLDDLACDGKAHTGAGKAIADLRPAVEAVEDICHVGFGNAGSLVGDAHHRFPILHMRAHSDYGTDGRVLQRIVEDLAQDKLDLFRIGIDVENRIDFRPEYAVLLQRLDAPQCGCDNAGKRNSTALDLELTGFDSRHLYGFVDELREAVGLFVDHSEQLTFLRLPRLAG